MFKNYLRTNIAEMREVTKEDTFVSLSKQGVSISDTDGSNGSPRVGDLIARNPNNHNDQWLVAEAYAKDNFKLEGE